MMGDHIPWLWVIIALLGVGALFGTLNQRRDRSRLTAAIARQDRLGDSLAQLHHKSDSIWRQVDLTDGERRQLICILIGFDAEEC